MKMKTDVVDQDLFFKHDVTLLFFLCQLFLSVPIGYLTHFKPRSMTYYHVMLCVL
jgi:hypothetical protein